MGVQWIRPLGRTSDEALLAGLATGDPQIAVAFVRRFQGIVYGVALAVLGDVQLAEDVAQRTFERAWWHAEMYDARRGAVKTWLTTIARNLAVDTARARRAVPADPADLEGLLGVMTATPEQHALAGDTAARMRAAVAELPLEQARAVVMAAVYGMTAQQVADAEHIPLGTAKTRIRAALGKLRTAVVPRRADYE